MPITAQLFDGTVLEFPDGTDPAVIDKVARQETLSRQPKEEASLGKRFTSSFERAGTSIGTGVRGAIGTQEEATAAAKAGAAEQERISREVGPTRGFAEVKDIYQREGFLPAAGEFVSQIPGAVAEQGANILGTLGAGFAGAKVGALAGPVGATVGGIAGAAGYLYPQFFGANLEEQARVAQEQKKQLELDRSSAAVAAAGQTALEAGGTAFTLGKNLIGKMIGKEVSKELAEKQLLQTAQASLAGGAGRGAARGLSEIPVEVAQTVLERWQSGQDLLSDDAIEKYGLAAYGALQAGPAIGAVASPLDRRAARQELEARGLTPTGETIEPPMTPEREAILRREQETADVMRERELQALELKKQEEEAAQLKNAGELSAKVGEIGQEIAGVSLEAEGLDDSLNSLYAAKDNLTILKQNLDRVSANKEVRQQINEQLASVNEKIKEGQAFAKTIGLEPTRRAKLAKEEVGYIPEERRAKASAAVFEGAAPEQVVMRELGPPQIALAPEVVDLTIKPQELIDIGLPKSAAYTKQLSGLDLGDADQRTKAADIIGRAMQNPQVKPEVKEKLQNLYDSKLAAPVPAAQGALDFEAELPPAAPVAPTKVDDSVLDTLGIGKTAVLRKNADLRNADLTKPEDRQFVRNVLETYRDAPNRSDSIKEKIDTFLEQLPVDTAPVVEAPETVKLYRGVQKGKEAEPTSGGGLFMSPDRTVAENYARGTGSVTEYEVTFNNLLTAKNWVEAKAKLGLPKSTSMDKLIRAARDAGHDGLAFDTTNGREYVVLNPELVQTPEVISEEGVQNVEPTPTKPAVVGQPSERGVGVDNVGGVPAATQEGTTGAATAPESGGLVRPAERAGIDTQGIEQAPAPVTEPSTTTSHDEALQRVAELQMGEEVDPKALAKLARDAADSGLITQTDRRQIATEIAEGDVVGAASSLEGMLQKSKDQSIPNAVQTLQATGDSAGAVTDNLTKAFTAQDPIAALQVIVNDNSGVFNPKEQLVARKILDMRMPMPTMRMVDSLGNDVNGEPILGEYNSINDEIALVQGAADSHTFLHEMIHAFVHRSIVLQERGQARNPNFRTLQEVYDHVKASRPDLAKEYGLSSLTEFASEAMSNRDFQFQLMGMPYRNQSVFSWFARALRSLLGIAESSPQGNVLFTAMVAVDGLMRSGRELQIRTTGKSIFASDIAYVAQNVNTPLGKPLPTSLAEVNQAPNQVQRTEMRKFLNTVSQGEAGYATLMRQQVVDILAPIAKRLSDAFSQGVRGQFGDVNPIVWMRQAFDHQRIALQVYRTGGLKLESNGLWTATELKDSQGKPASPQMIVEKLAELAKKNNSTYQTTKAKVATVLEGMRLKELRDHNRKLETLALEQAAAGDVDAAYETRLGKVLLHRTNAEIDALVNVFNKSPEIQEIQRIMNTVRGNLIDAMVTSGRIRKEQADNWKAAVNYVPFDRLKDISENPEIVFAAGRKGIAALGKLPQLKGSLGRPVANAIDNYMHKLAWMTEQSMRNSAVVRTLNIMADAGMATKLDSPKNATNTHLVLPALYEGGNPVFFEVQNQYDLAAFAEAPEIKGSLINVFSASSRLLRTTVTATPMFALKQVFDDAQRVMFYSGVKNPLAAMGKTLINLPRILFLKNFGGNKSVIDSLERSGIVGDYDFNPINPIETVEFDTNAVRRSPVRALVHAMEQVTKASDMAARLAVYEQTMRETGDAVLAQSRARELINFNRRGASKTMRMLTHIIPFFNSWAQGTDLLYRGFTGEDASSGMAKKAAAGMFISRILTMMAMGTMYALVMSDDEGYEETSDEVRDRAWILPKSVSDAFGMKQPLKIPVPIELGFIFKSIPERALQYYKDHTKDEAKPAVDAALDFLRGAVTVYGNEPIPAILRPALENYTNFSFFTKRELISPSLKAKPAALQYTPATSEFAKWLGEQTSTSPIQIDNFVRGYFGLMGSTASMMLDSMMNPARPDRGLEQLPFLSIGIMAPVGSRTKDDFYEFREKVAAAVAGKNSLKDDPEKQAKFIEKNYHLLAAAPYVNAKLKMLRTIREQKKIYESGADIGMSGAERRDAINELKRIETEILSDIGRVRTDYIRLKE